MCLGSVLLIDDSDVDDSDVGTNNDDDILIYD
jgi:hypothetical protein